MQRAAIFSALLHIFIMIVAVTGLPFLNHNNNFIIPTPIAIEILPIAAETRAPKPAPIPVKKENKDKPIAEQPKPTPPVTPPTPEPTPLKPQPETKPEPLQDVNPKPIADAVPLPQPKPQPKPEPQLKPIEPPPTPPTRPKPKIVKDSTPQKSYDDVLKNIMKMKPAVTNDDKADNKITDNVSQDVGKVGPALTMSEMDALRQQIKGCWAINPGAKDIENFVVTIKIIVNPDRTIRDAKTIANNSFSYNGFYQSFAESALRAVLNPLCSPLKLPEGKYEQWKDLELNFTPSDLIR